MKITKKDVEHVARLARIKLTEEEKKKFTKQLDQILKYMDKLNELDTSKVEPTSHVLPLKNVMRKDKVKPSLPRDEVLENVPDKARGHFKVPKIIG